MSPLDGLVIARVIAILGLALLTASPSGDPAAGRLVIAVLAVAALQPLLPMVWKYQGPYRQAQW